MKRCIIMFSIMLPIAISGCGLYETKEDKQGRTIRVNRLTGDVAIVDGDKLVRVKSEKEVAQEKMREDKLSVTKGWDKSMLLNEIPVGLKTKWVDGIMSYQLSVEGNLRTRGTYFSEITAVFKDKDDFHIAKIPIKSNAFTGLVGFDGKTVSNMSYSDQLPLSKDEYARITSWELIWSGFKDQ
ncbi:hypothetical protein GMST_15480 [Geomonas silvestris]|uniref:Lipoprotein n=1 Tax=Geomonas silvestris TaxID=2740184 RepID=A0A6V8MHF4_9BACT|nr:hypothetical protein [Geomonas silvestris]GFO59223.1 hypothetical protein GMST_15480 [Geomonas silvestris]